MQSKNRRIFEIEDKAFIFDCCAFNRMFCKKAKEAQAKIMDYEYYLADYLHLTHNAVHNWRFGMSGPNSVEVVMELADLWGYDYKFLLQEVYSKERTGEENMVEKERVETEAFQRVYIAMLDYVTLYEKTNGFKLDEIPEETRGTIMQEWTAAYDKMKYALRKELFVLSEELFYQLDKSIFEMERWTYGGINCDEDGKSSDSWLYVMHEVNGFLNEMKNLYEIFVA